MAPVPTTHPRWTPLGTLATSARALVDGRGRVAAAPGWALDWWVGADDRWHLPDREVSVRQHLVGSAPVVETAMRIPGGDAVHRAYAVRDRGADGEGRDLLVVEIENRSAVPFAVALVVTPFDGPEGPGGPGRGGSVSELALEGSVLLVDGRPGLATPKAPARAGATADHRDLEALVVSGQAPATLAPLTSPGGAAGGALIYPLPHTAVLRAVLPLAAPVSRRGRRAGRAERFALPEALATAEQVAKGWEAQTRRPMTITVPDERWTSVTEASRGFLLLGAQAGIGAVPTWAASVTMIGALDRWGFGAEAARALAGAGDERLDARPVDGATLVALADHWSFTRDRVELAGHDLAIAAAVHRADRPGRSGRRLARPAAAGDPGQDRAWRARGLAAATVLLEALDQPEAAAVVGERAGALLADSGDPTDPDGPAVAHPMLGGLSPARTLERAAHDLADPATSPMAATRVAWALSVLGPTTVWPEAVDPDRPELALGRGHDPVAGAAWLTFVRTLLVREAGTAADPALALVSWLPPSWRGQGFEVHHAPTHVGSLSYAVRWHGPRPALLWELEPHPGRPGSPVTLRAPGLDGAWSTREPRGEALLAAVDDQPVGPDQLGPRLPGSPGEGASFS